MSDDRRLFSALLATILMLLVAGIAPTHAATFGFTNITHNGNPDLSGQLSLSIADAGFSAGANHASFTFQNAGPIASSVTEVYFYESQLTGALTLPATIINGTGVSFVPGANPSHLPGAPPGTFGFLKYSADTEKNTADGVNPGETLAIILALTSGTGFGDVISAILADTLRVGVHVRGIGTREGSDAYLATTPLPGALPLLATGVISLGLLRRMRKRHTFAAAA